MTNVDLAKKWQGKVLQFHEHLEILYDIYPDHNFNCKEWEAIYTQYENKFPPLVSPDGNVAKVQADDE